MPSNSIVRLKNQQKKKIYFLFQETRKGHMATTFSQIKVDSSLGDLPRGDLRTLMDESDDYDNGN